MFGPYEMVMDFAIMSMLLIVAHILRAKVKLFQLIYVPSALIAGFLALFGGYQFLDIIPFAMRTDGSPFMVSYPYLLVVVLFGSLFLGRQKNQTNTSLKNIVHNVGDTFFYNTAVEMGQFACALLFGILILTPLFPDLYHGFALMWPAGFAGGHGYATAIGKVLQNAGWDEALTVGYTSATVGLLAGVVGGMILINIGTRRGWTRLVKNIDQLPKSMLTGFVPENERVSMGKETVNPIALDPFTWHFALVISTFGLAFYLYDFIKTIIPGNYEIPMMCISMLCGCLLQKTFDTVNLGQYIDKNIMNRIGSWITDYLVAFGVASIKISVVVQYAMPMTLLFSFGIFYCIAIFFLVGRRIFHNFWFERSIFVFGWSTGVVAMGVTLLRIVDPKFKTKALEDYGLAYVPISMIEIVIITILPTLVINNILLLPALGLMCIFIVCLLASRYFIGWFKKPNKQLREGEEVIIEEFNAEMIASQSTMKDSPLEKQEKID